MRDSRGWWWLGVLLLALGCGSSDERPVVVTGERPVVVTGERPVVAASGGAEDAAVLEAVFLYELRAVQPSGDGICLRVRTSASGAAGDASDSLIAAIRRRFPNARKGSECSGGGPEPVRVTAGGGPAMVLDIGPVVWDGRDRARVHGGGVSRGGSFHIVEIEYTLERGPAWRVTSERVVQQT